MLADALRFTDWTRMELGQLDDQPNAQRALAIYEELGDLTGQAHAMNVLGASAYWRGDWMGALDFYRKCLVIDRRTGNPVNLAFGHLNIGEIFLDQGRLDDAEGEFTEALREWRASGYRSGVGAATAMLARVAGCRGRFDEAAQLFEDALGEFRAIGSHIEELETEARVAECQLLSGDATRAVAMADAALAQARSLGGVSAQLPLLLRVRGAALSRSGAHDDAVAALGQSMDAARSRNAEHEVALTGQVLARVLVRAGDGTAAALAASSESTLHRLGVVWTPDLLDGTTSPPVASPTVDRPASTTHRDRRVTGA